MQMLCHYSTSARKPGRVVYNCLGHVGRGLREDLTTEWEFRHMERWCKREDRLFERYPTYLEATLKLRDIGHVLTAKDLSIMEARHYEGARIF